MKNLVFVVMAFAGAQTMANDRLLTCVFQKGKRAVDFNVNHLISDAGCVGQTYQGASTPSPVRYQVSICNFGKEAYGSTEVQTTAGDWVEVNTFSNERGGQCYFRDEFKPIDTNYPCVPDRHSHQGGCAN